MQWVRSRAMRWERRPSGRRRPRRGRCGRRLEFWAAGDKNQEASQQAAFLLQAIADADWDIVERRAGLHVGAEKIDPWKQENPASNGRGLIDDFRLWGSPRCQQ